MTHGFEPSLLSEEASTRIPDTTNLLLMRKAKQFGQVRAEYIRDLICLDVHGATYDELMIQHRRALRAAQGAAQGAVQGLRSAEVAAGGVA